MVYGYYGVRISLGDIQEYPDELMDLLQTDSDPRIVAATSAGLDVVWGRDTDGGELFLLIGREICTIGVEYDVSVSLSSARFDEIKSAVDRVLPIPGVMGPAQLHFQLNAQY